MPPALAPWLDSLFFLSGISGCFWLLSWLLGHWALVIHDVLIAELADCFAILYNAVLAVAFAAIIAFSVANAGPEGLLWRQALGFVFVYFILSAAYTDPGTGGIDDYSILGYLAGLGAYLAFSIHPEPLRQPWIAKAFALLVWMSKNWIGRALSVYAGWRLAAMAWRALRELFNRRPPIRLRKQED